MDVRLAAFSARLDTYPDLAEKLAEMVCGESPDGFSCENYADYGYKAKTPADAKAAFAVDALLWGLGLWGGGVITPEAQVSAFLTFLKDDGRDFFLSKELLKKHEVETCSPLSWMVSHMKFTTLPIVSACCLMAAAGDERADFPNQVVFPSIDEKTLAQHLSFISDWIGGRGSMDDGQEPHYGAAAIARIKQKPDCFWRDGYAYQSQIRTHMATTNAGVYFDLRVTTSVDEVASMRVRADEEKPASRWDHLKSGSLAKRPGQQAKVIPLFGPKRI